MDALKQLLFTVFLIVLALAVLAVYFAIMQFVQPFMG